MRLSVFQFLILITLAGIFFIKSDHFRHLLMKLNNFVSKKLKKNKKLK